MGLELCQVHDLQHQTHLDVRSVLCELNDFLQKRPLLLGDGTGQIGRHEGR